MPTALVSPSKKILSSALAAMITLGPVLPASGQQFSNNRGSDETATPIKHVIVIVGENRSFDHLFATYVPTHGETVNNLLSEGIVKADGTPGSNYARATQYNANA